MATPGYSLAISAVDNVSGPLAKINAKLEASQTAATKRVSAAVAPWQRFGAQIQKTGKLLGFDKAQAGLAKLGKGFQTIGHYSMDAFRNIARIVDPLAAITGALSLAGMYKLISAWSDFGTQLGFASTRIGMGVSQLQGLQGAAQLAGVSAGALTSGLQDLGQTLYDAAGGRNQQAVALMNQLGISWQKGRGQAKSVADVLPQVADAIAKLKDPYAQAQAAAILFGGAAEEMLPFLRLGSKGIAEYNAAALKYGVMNRKGVEAANDFRMAQVKVELAVRGLTNSIAEKLSPILVPLLTQMADWIAANRAWIATKIGDYVSRFVTVIKSLDWKGMKTEAQGFWNEINGVAKSLGGWTDVAKGVLAFMAVSWVAGMLAPIVAITNAILGISTALAAIPLLFPVIAAAIVAAGLGDMFLHGSTSATDTMSGPPAAGGEGDKNSTPITPKQAGANAQQLQQFFQKNGMNNAGTAAMMGQAKAESGFNPGATAPNGDYGIFQWGPARRAMFKKVMGFDIHGSTEAQQLQFAQIELTKGDYKDVGSALYGGKLGVDADSMLLTRRYEAPKDLMGRNGFPARDLYANEYLNGMNLPVPANAPTVPAPAMTATAKTLGFAGGPGRSPSGPAAPLSAPDKATAPATAQVAAAMPKISHVPAADAETKRLIAAGEADYNASMEIVKAALVGVPPVALPSASTSAQAGKVDVAVKISHDGSIKSATKTTGVGVGKLRVDTPMQAHAA
jgi:hypothetical protein